MNENLTPFDWEHTVDTTEKQANNNTTPETANNDRKKKRLERLISTLVLEWQKAGKDLMYIRTILDDEFKSAIIISSGPGNTQIAEFSMDRILKLIENSTVNFYFPSPQTNEQQLNFVTIPPADGRKMEDKGMGNEFKKPERVFKLLRITESLSSKEIQYSYLAGQVSPEQMRTLPYDGIYMPTLKVLIAVCDEKENITFVIHEVADEKEAVGLLQKTKTELKSPELNTRVHLITYSSIGYEERVLEAVKNIRPKTRESVATGLTLQKRAQQHGLSIIAGQPGLYLEGGESDTLWASTGFWESIGIHKTTVAYLVNKIQNKTKQHLRKTGPQIKDGPDIQLTNYSIIYPEYQRIQDLPELNNLGMAKFGDGEYYAIDLYFVKHFKGTAASVVRKKLAIYKNLEGNTEKTAREAGSIRERSVYKVTDTITFMQQNGCRIETTPLTLLKSDDTCEIEGKTYISKSGIAKMYGKSSKLRRFMKTLESIAEHIETKQAYTQNKRLRKVDVYNLQDIQRAAQDHHLEPTPEKEKSLPEINSEEEVVIDNVVYISLNKLETITGVDRGNIKIRCTNHKLLFNKAIKKYEVERVHTTNYTGSQVIQVVEKDKALELYKKR